jgi:hypothetical protein
VEGAGQVVVQVEGRFQRDEVQFRNGSTRIRVDYRCEVTADRPITSWALSSPRASAIASLKTGVVSMSILPIAVQTVVSG